MIGGKVVLTYKRKRPPLRTDFCHGNNLANKSAECTISNTSSASNKHEESTEDDKSENRKRDSGVCVELVAGGIRSVILQSDGCYHPSCAQSINFAKDVPEGKRLCSGCVRDHDILTSRNARNFNKIKVQHLSEKSDTDELGFCSCSLLERSAGGNGCQDNSGGAFAKDSYAEENLAHDKGGPCSCMNSGSLHEHKCTKKSSLCLSVKTDSGICPDLANLDSSIEKEYNIQLVATSAPKTEGSEGTSSLLKDKPCISCVNAIEENKLTSPLITFRRRSKRVKDVNGPDRQSNLQGGDYCVSTVEGSEPTFIVRASTFEASSTCSVDHPVHDMHSVDNANKNHSLGEAQGIKSSQSPDSVHAPLDSVPENNFRAMHEKEPALSPRCSVKDRPPIAQGKGSDCPSNEGLKTTQVPDDIGSNEGSLAAGDLSIPPPGMGSLSDGVASCKIMDSHFVVDCNIALESDSDDQANHNVSQVLGDSVESASQSTLLEVSPGDKGLNLSSEGIGENLSSEKAQLLEHECSSIKAIGNEGCDCLNSPVFPERMCKNNYLQLFPEDISNDMSPLGKSHADLVDCKDFEERSGNLTESWKESKPPSARHQLFLGHSLAMEPAIEVHAQNSTLVQWPNVGLQSKEFLQDSVSQLFPDQTSSLLRHQMMLDSNINRARVPKGYRNGFLGRFETPSLWLEEELDSLWVGVRRHGRGNWECILKDPRLHFLSWRTPRDLAERWQEEMHNLFNNVPVRTTEHLLLDRLNSLFCNKTRKENVVDDTQLSLGEVYSQSMDGLQNRPMFKYANVQDDVHNQLQKTCPSSRARKRTRLFNHREGKVLISNSSPNADPTTRMTSNGNLPHWLKEVVAIPPMRQDPSLLSLASPVSFSPMQTIDQPYLESSGIHHETRRRSNGAHATSSSEVQTGGRACWGSSPQVTRHGKNGSAQYHVDAQQNLIIIDSDASSEETISDDHSVRP